jgi:hypothetical protein
MEVAAFFVEWVSALGMRDTQSGFRAYPVALLDDVGGCREGFVLETEVLIAAARRGWRVREVDVSSIPSARRRSRFRPVRDGVAIGAYLTGQALIQWGREIKASAARRVGGHPRPGRHSPERRRRARAALATVATPVLLGAAVMQAGLGLRGSRSEVTRSCGGSTRAIASRARQPPPGALRHRGRTSRHPSRRRGRVGREARFAARCAERALVRRGARIRGYAFTIVGVAVGVAGLVALGAMSERIVRFIDGGIPC